MLKKTMPFALFAAVALWAVADNAARLTVLFRDGTSTVVDMDVDDEVTLDHEGGTLVLPQGVTYPLADIASFFFDEPEGGAEGGEVEPSDDLTTVYVEWTEGAAPRVRSSAPGIIVQTDGQHVSLNNTDTTSEITYVLSGAASNASFTLVAEYKSTIRLDGVSLTSDAGAAINILCGKRIALELVEGTTSVLSDASEDFGQKAALYCKGHLEVSGGGNLQLTGHVKHALSTKEYLQLKRTTGTIEVLSAASDGLHAGQYFLMNGGDVRISSVGGDGIQAEITDDPADEQNGQLIINGGTLDISIAGTDVAALKSDSLLTVNDGEFKLTTSGEGAKGVKSKTDICLLGGTFRISQQGNPYILDGETTYVAAIKGNNVALGQLASNLNCDFNQLQSGICAVQAAIQEVGGKVGYSAERVINAVNLGDMNIVQQMKDCCCQTQQNIIKMGYENQLGQKDIVNGMQQGFSYTNTGLERGFSNVGFQMSQLACDLKTNANDNTQRIIDTMNAHWQSELQQRYNDARLELSQQRQNATLVAALKTTATT